MKRIFALAALAAASALSAPAHADHDDPEHPQSTNRTAYTVPAQHHKIGLFSVEYGFTDNLQMITWPFWWTILAPNYGMKWRFYNGDVVDLAFGGTFLYVSTRPLSLIFEELPIADLFIWPVDLNSSFVLHEDWTLSVGGQYTAVVLTGTFNDDDFQGAAATSNLQAHATIEWKINETVALNVHGRYLVFQTAAIGTEIETSPDEFTTIRAQGIVSSDILDFPHAFQIVPGIHLSWDTFNLTAGLGYGNYILPALNFVLPNRGPVPQLDIYWRF